MFKLGTWLFLVSESLWLMPGHLFILDELESPWQALKGDQKLRVLIACGKSVKRGRAIETQLLRRGKLEMLNDVAKEVEICKNGLRGDR